MKITPKNIAILMLMFFLISNQIIGLGFEILKASVYCILFLLVLSKISPDLYEYFIKLFNLNDFQLSNIPKSILSIITKLKSFVPIFKKSTEGYKNENLVYTNAS